MSSKSDQYDFLSDDLVSRVLRSRGGQRFLNMTDREMRQFLTSTESTLVVGIDDTSGVKASIDKARADVSRKNERKCDLYLRNDIAAAAAIVGAISIVEEDGYVLMQSQAPLGGL
jgi:hypothetical protein